MKHVQKESTDTWNALSIGHCHSTSSWSDTPKISSHRSHNIDLRWFFFQQKEYNDLACGCMCTFVSKTL